MGTLRFIGDTAMEVSSQSTSNTPTQRRKTIADGAVSFTLGETPFSDINKDSTPSDHMTSSDQSDEVAKGSLGELTMTQKGSLKRGESEDTINGEDDQNGAGDTITLSEETVHVLEKDGKITTNTIDRMVEDDMRSDVDKLAPDVEWAPATRCVQ